MNKINSIYATEVHEEDPHSHIKDTFQAFRNRLDANIKDTVAFKKKIIAKQSTECFEQLQKIKEQSERYKKKIYEQEKEFEINIESQIKHDINKWNDYHNYFKNGFDQLEHSIETHKIKNKERIKRINLKKIQLKGLLQDQKQSHVRISSLVKKAEESSHLTTKESSIVRSLTKRQRIKTESSLPILKPHRYERIKTIQSDYDEEETNHSRSKRVMSYMEPIGTLRKKEQSSFPILVELLRWYKQKEEGSIGDNWFLKILFRKRHFNKLILFLEENSLVRKVERKL